MKLNPEFKLNPPASRNEITHIEQSIGMALPDSYIEFLLGSDGGEGPIGAEGYLILSPLASLPNELKKLSQLGAGASFLPIGSDGGGEYFVISYLYSEPSFGFLPAINPSTGNYAGISGNFWSALQRIGEGKAFDM